MPSAANGCVYLEAARLRREGLKYLVNHYREVPYLHFDCR